MSRSEASSANRRSGVLVVAPLEATWPELVTVPLVERGYAVARMKALSLIGFLMTSAGVAGLFVDACLLDTDAAVACVRAIARDQAPISTIVVGALTEQGVKRTAGLRFTAVLPRPPAREELAGWFPDLRRPPSETGRG